MLLILMLGSIVARLTCYSTRNIEFRYNLSRFALFLVDNGERLQESVSNLFDERVNVLKK